MNRKQYQTPVVTVCEMTVSIMLCISGGVKSNNGMAYGGVDEEGEREADTRQQITNGTEMWDCDWWEDN